MILENRTYTKKYTLDMIFYMDEVYCFLIKKKFLAEKAYLQ
ncbi:hypothetical protein EHF_0616 [Ehrlichia japonica]|uniref:Uncharacterized protein n=1 Tax=Ehrlichia japonica TaxID=391036 RepID=X5H3Y2_9RICK|nr:hypothetical protein EHF_0616 [Ehrlichia japonica]